MRSVGGTARSWSDAQYAARLAVLSAFHPRHRADSRPWRALPLLRAADGRCQPARNRPTQSKEPMSAVFTALIAALAASLAVVDPDNSSEVTFAVKRWGARALGV